MAGSGGGSKFQQARKMASRQLAGRWAPRSSGCSRRAWFLGAMPLLRGAPAGPAPLHPGVGEHWGGAALGAGGAGRSVFTATSNTHSEIYKKVRDAEAKIKMTDLIQFGKDANRSTLLTSAQWLQKDLPVRLSHRVQVCHPPLPTRHARSARRSPVLGRTCRVFCLVSPLPERPLFRGPISGIPDPLCSRVQELQSLPTTMFNTKPVIDLCNL